VFWFWPRRRGLKYGFFPRIIQTKIFWKNNLDMTQKGLAKYGGRGPKIAFVINGQPALSGGTTGAAGVPLLASSAARVD
jgi:hypothetical protein